MRGAGFSLCRVLRRYPSFADVCSWMWSTPTWIGGTHIFVFVFVLVSFITAIDSRSHGC